MAEAQSACMTPAEAGRVQDAAREHARWLMWFVSVTEGKARAWAVLADSHGGRRLPGELRAATLDELRARLPAGLTRWERASTMPSEVVEVWD